MCVCTSIFRAQKVRTSMCSARYCYCGNNFVPFSVDFASASATFVVSRCVPHLSIRLDLIRLDFSLRNFKLLNRITVLFFSEGYVCGDGPLENETDAFQYALDSEPYHVFWPIKWINVMVSNAIHIEIHLFYFFFLYFISFVAISYSFAVIKSIHCRKGIAKKIRRFVICTRVEKLATFSVSRAFNLLIDLMVVITLSRRLSSRLIRMHDLFTRLRTISLRHTAAQSSHEKRMGI